MNAAHFNRKLAQCLRCAATAGAALALSACTHFYTLSNQPLQMQSWVQADAQGQWVVRSVAPQDGACPTVQWAGVQTTLLLRAPADSADMPKTCEMAWPAGATSLTVAGQELRPPPARVRRIVVLGDTGCRLKDNSVQDCNDPMRWPFAQIARTAALKRPDLVLHVGDYHYRETPCPPGRPGCAGSPSGYGMAAWQADFLTPAAPLLQVAPWVFVRGNHESCWRAGVLWQRLYDPQRWSAERSCQRPQDKGEGDFAEPYAVALDEQTQVIVFDSSLVGLKAYPTDSPVYQRYVRQMHAVTRLAQKKPHSFFVHHHPVLGFFQASHTQVYGGNAALHAIMGTVQGTSLLPGSVDLVMAGHIHSFQGMDFDSAHPAALVVGHGGSDLDTAIAPDLARTTAAAPAARLRQFVTRADYGFVTLDRLDNGHWQITDWDALGQQHRSCRLSGRQLLDCTP